MELTLNRTLKLPDRTIGKLSVNGKPFCDVIEDTVRFSWLNGKLMGLKIFGKTAIPTGRYEVIMSYSNRFKKVLPLLVNVPQFDGVRMHSGNTAEDSEACLIVGVHDPKKNIVVNSRVTLQKLLDIIEPASKKGKIFITIN